MHQASSPSHDDVIKWKHFPRYWPLCGDFTGPGAFPAQRPVTRSFDVFFDLGLNERLSKQPRGWWFETPSWSLWRQCNAVLFSNSFLTRNAKTPINYIWVRMMLYKSEGILLLKILSAIMFRISIRSLISMTFYAKSSTHRAHSSQNFLWVSLGHILYVV